jgi:hypothetical protein
MRFVYTFPEAESLLLVVNMNIFILLDSWLDLIPARIMRLVRMLEIDQRKFAVLSAVVSGFTPLLFCLGPSRDWLANALTAAQAIMAIVVTYASVEFVQSYHKLVEGIGRIEATVMYHSQTIYRTSRLTAFFLWPVTGVFNLIVHESHPLLLLLLLFPPFATPAYLMNGYVPVDHEELEDDHPEMN